MSGLEALANQVLRVLKKALKKIQMKMMDQKMTVLMNQDLNKKR